MRVVTSTASEPTVSVALLECWSSLTVIVVKGTITSEDQQTNNAEGRQDELGSRRVRQAKKISARVIIRPR